MNFTERIREIQKSTNSLLCIGIDPVIEKMPRSMQDAGDPVFAFSQMIIESTSDLVCAFKFNLAFFEAYGPAGMESLRKSVASVPNTIITIGDGKRNDIGSSAGRYAGMLFDEYKFDAVTVNPYMGTDSIEPFIQHPEKGTFILALTSNPGSKDFQKLKVGNHYLYEKVIQRAKKWNRNGNIGLVVGATQTRDLAGIRKKVPEMPILLPGIGAQGGDLKKSVASACSKNKDLLLINIGRSVIYAQKVRDTALEMQALINSYRK